MLFYFWQLHPATPGESKTISRPPEGFSPFKVLSASPLALLPVGLTCFISTGRSQNTILARLDWLYLAVQLTNPLGFLSILISSRDCTHCLQRNVSWQFKSVFLVTYLWPEILLNRQIIASKPRALLPYESGLNFASKGLLMQIRIAINVQLFNTHVKLEDL